MAARPVFDAAGVAAHGIGRGDFVALVFAGAIDELGDVAGHYTWNTARKFALTDHRLSATRDLARLEHSPLPEWPEDSVRPTPGVCFVFADANHPAVFSLRAQGGLEFEHFVTLPELTVETVRRRRLKIFLDEAGVRPVVMLGFGDQGRRVAEELVRPGRECVERYVVESDASRSNDAARFGLVGIAPDNERVANSAILSTPLARPWTFARIVADARRDGRAVLDNSLPWDNRREFEGVGPLRLTCAAARVLSTDSAWSSCGVPVQLLAARDDTRMLGGSSIRHLSSGHRLNIGMVRGEVLARASVSDALSKCFVRANTCWAGIDGQSNQHDAAVSIFAAREFLAEYLAHAVARVMPSDHRVALGATLFERTVMRTTTGRSLGAPFMTACEQTTVGLLAAAFSSDAPIVEIGSAIGGSTLLMAAATATGMGTGPEIVSIDPDAPTRPMMRALFEVEGHAERLRQVVKTSGEAIAELQQLAGKVGLVFIDGLHTAEAVLDDYVNYAALIRVGGCLAFHDADLRFNGIYRVVADRVMRDRRFRPLFMVDSIAAFQRVDIAE